MWNVCVSNSFSTSSVYFIGKISLHYFMTSYLSSPYSAGSKNKVMSMVEQFNLRSSKSNGRNSVRDVKITAPVITPPKSVSNGHTPSQSPPPPETTWKHSPLYRSFDSDEDVPEMIKRFSDGAVAAGFRSDTLSSDIIVNSISTGTQLED